MATNECESEHEGEGIHDLLVWMPGHLSAKGKDNKGEDDEEHPGPEPSNAEVANNDKMDQMDQMDTASHKGQVTAEMVWISLPLLFGFWMMSPEGPTTQAISLNLWWCENN